MVNVFYGKELGTSDVLGRLDNLFGFLILRFLYHTEMQLVRMLSAVQR